MEYFKDLTAEQHGDTDWYCDKAKCLTCKYSYGPIKDMRDPSKYMLCRRLWVDCEYKPLDRVVLKRVVDREIYDRWNGQTTFKYIVSEE